MTSPDAADADQVSLGWVLAGYEAHPWTRVLDAQAARLVRVGAWWREKQACVPVTAEVIGERVVIVNDLILVLTDYGDVTMVLSPEARLAASSAQRANGAS